MKREFTFDHLAATRLGDPMHFHSYALEEDDGDRKIQLAEQLSTDTTGIATYLGLQSNAKVGLQFILARIEAKLSEHTLMTIETPPLAASLIGDAEEDDG